MNATTPDSVEPVKSLKEFFRDSVERSMQRQGVEAEAPTAHYVVCLLTLFARSEALFDDSETRRGIRPLALMLSDALEATSPTDRTVALQRLGDVSLFVAGFFSASLADKAVDVDYYISMGGGAYRSLSNEVGRTPRGAQVAPIFDELSSKFTHFVDVLADIREHASGQPDCDVLRLYELWLRTGSRRAERALRALGIEPNGSLDRRVRH